jgi:hypothetical protein
MTLYEQGRLAFYESTHEYRLDGVIKPGATQVLEDVGLSDYSRIPVDQLAAAQERGDRVHEITRLWDISDLDETSLNDFGRRYLDSWVKFRAHYLPTVSKFDLVESPLASLLYQYAGRPDRVVRGLCVLDIKSGADCPSARYQLAAYEQLWKEELEPKDRLERWVVYLSPDGEEGRLVRCKDKTDWSIFMSAKNVYHAKRK